MFKITKQAAFLLYTSAKRLLANSCFYNWLNIINLKFHKKSVFQILFFGKKQFLITSIVVSNAYSY